MRFSKALLTAVAAFAAMAVAAQESPPAGDPPAKAKAEPGLSDLDETVDRLLQEESRPAGEPAPSAPESPPAETPAASAALHIAVEGGDLRAPA